MQTRSDELLSAKSLLNEDDAPELGHGPDYLKHLRNIVRKAARHGVVFYARLSDPRPGQRETTGDQLHFCNDHIGLLEKEFGVTIKVWGTFHETVSGWKWKKSERAELVKAKNLAIKHKAILVAPDGSRFVRNEGCEFGAEPTVDDFAQLMKLVGNAQLATIADPNIHEDRSRSVKRGHAKAKARGVKLGRPKKKSYRKPFNAMPNKFARVVRLRDSGLSWPKIVKAVGRPKSTVRGWYKKAKKASQK